MIIFTTAILTLWLNSVWLYPFSVVVIGSRMMGLWALLHDGHHNMLVNSKRINRKLSEWFLAWPLFKSLEEFGEQHNAHHKYLGKEGDPNFGLLRYSEYQFPMKRSKLLGVLLKDLLGVNFVFYRFQSLIKAPSVLWKGLNKWTLEGVAYYVVLLVLLVYFNLWKEFILFWVIPFITYFQFLIRVTLISDHCFAGSNPPLVRTVRLNWFEQLFMVPHNLNYHYEHHQYGGVPCYNLSRLHKQLITNRSYSRSAELCIGYLDVFNRLTRTSTG